MSSPPPPAKPADDAEAIGDPQPAKGIGRNKLILIAAPILLLMIAGALWFSGVLPRVFGMEKHEDKTAEVAKPVPPSYVDVPEMVANLNSGSHKPAYVKLLARVEVPKPDDVDKVRAALPRLQDMMQTYLREMRPEELRGSAGTYRLREELLVRANAAVAPAKVSDVLFTQMLVQ
jgi:flagellar FliL protein